jgi:hypothetical protein
MQLPEVGWLELNNNNTSPLRFYPLNNKDQHKKHRPYSVTLGNDFPAKISVQSKVPTVKSAFHLPLRSKKTTNGAYQLGPFIAILTSDGRHPFAGNHRNFADLILRGKRMGVTVYVLTLS